MSSRKWLKHTASTTTPPDLTLGDEWFDTSQNKLFKRVAVNGTSVQNQEIQPAILFQGNSVSATVTGPATVNFLGATTSYDSVSKTLNIVSSGIPGGSNTSIQYNNSGTFAGSSNLTWNNATNTLTVAGTVLIGSSSVVDWKNTTTQWTLSGGGLVTWTGSALLWSQRVIAIPVERSEMGSSGYFDITCPTSGTITYYNNLDVTTTVTCTAAGIPLGSWEALYYEVTEGMAEPTSQTRFRVVHYQNTVWRPGPGWILIAAVNGDGTNIGHLKWMPGQVNLPTIGSTVTYNSGRGISSWSAGFLPQTDATTILNPTSSITSSGARATVLAPNTYSNGVFSEFKNSSAFSFTGNYTGLITYASWVGTTASTGDPSYQLAFHPNAANATTNPRLKFRAGIDTTWGSWGEVSHTGVTDLNIRHNSIGVNVAASTNAGQISTTTSNNTNLVINNSSGTDRYFISATGAVNSFTVYENTNVAYINSYSGMALRANQNGGSGGGITLSGGTVTVSSQLLDVVAATPASTNAIRARSIIQWLSPDQTRTYTAKMLDTGTLSFEPGGAGSSVYSFGSNTAVAAAGTTSGTATAITRSVNIITSGTVNQGVRLPVPVGGERVFIRNNLAVDLKVYPNTGGQINNSGVDVGVTLTASSSLEYVAGSTTLWFTINATYA